MSEASKVHSLRMCTVKYTDKFMMTIAGKMISDCHAMPALLTLTLHQSTTYLGFTLIVQTGIHSKIHGVRHTVKFTDKYTGEFSTARNHSNSQQDSQRNYCRNDPNSLLRSRPLVRSLVLFGVAGAMRSAVCRTSAFGRWDGIINAGDELCSSALRGIDWLMHRTLSDRLHCIHHALAVSLDDCPENGPLIRQTDVSARLVEVRQRVRVLSVSTELAIWTRLFDYLIALRK